MRWTTNEVWDLAREMGLDPFPTEFHTVPAHVLYDTAARGIPGRYSHWSHGMAWYHEITKHNHGMGRIYELVINSNPSHAFLLDVNSDVINLMVMAHVLGHTDFFKHNRVFGPTDRRMVEHAALRGERIRQYQERYGVEKVEHILDALLTIQLYADPDGYAPTLRKDKPPAPDAYADILDIGKPSVASPVDMAEQRRTAGLPTRDILGFLIAEAPLEDWERDLVSIVREDGLHFWPQIRTKTINEGWASFWHQKLMRALDLSDGEYTEYARINGGVVCAHPGHLNPYWLGVNILKDVEKRFGQERLFEVRRYETDVSLVRNYLTRELVEELGLVRYGERNDYYVVTEDDWEQVRDGIANDFAGRLPEIVVADRDAGYQGRLLLRHVHDGRNLNQQKAMRILEYLERIWRRPVYLETFREGGTVTWNCGGTVVAS